MPDDSRTSGRPPAVALLSGLLAFQGISGLGGGLALILDPTGEAIGIPVAWLDGSPFPDYLIPGVVLFALLGLIPLLVARAVWLGRPRSWMASLIVGAALVTWIAVQILVVGYQARPPLQLTYGSVGVLLLVLSMSASVRRFTEGR